MSEAAPLPHLNPLDLVLPRVTKSTMRTLSPVAVYFNSDTSSLPILEGDLPLWYTRYLLSTIRAF